MPRAARLRASTQSRLGLLASTSNCRCRQDARATDRQCPCLPFYKISYLLAELVAWSYLIQLAAMQFSSVQFSSSTFSVNTSTGIHVFRTGVQFSSISSSSTVNTALESVNSARESCKTLYIQGGPKRHLSKFNLSMQLFKTKVNGFSQMFLEFLRIKITLHYYVQSLILCRLAPSCHIQKC